MITARAFGQNGLFCSSRGISSTPAVFMRFAPHLPSLSDSNGEEYDPKRETLESFLNIRFGDNFPTINDDKNPNRDLVNFPRPVQPDFPETVRLGILPESWFKMFYNKTGVTGPYVFLGTFGTFLLSKEWLVFEHELLVGIEATIILVFCIKAFGPNVRKSLCEQVDVSFHTYMFVININETFDSIDKLCRMGQVAKGNDKLFERLYQE